MLPLFIPCLVGMATLLGIYTADTTTGAGILSWILPWRLEAPPVAAPTVIPTHTVTLTYESWVTVVAEPEPTFSAAPAVDDTASFFSSLLAFAQTYLAEMSAMGVLLGILALMLASFLVGYAIARRKYKVLGSDPVPPSLFLEHGQLSGLVFSFDGKDVMDRTLELMDVIPGVPSGPPFTKDEGVPAEPEQLPSSFAPAEPRQPVSSFAPRTSLPNPNGRPARIAPESKLAKMTRRERFLASQEAAKAPQASTSAAQHSEVDPATQAAAESDDSDAVEDTTVPEATQETPSDAPGDDVSIEAPVTVEKTPTSSQMPGGFDGDLSQVSDDGADLALPPTEPEATVEARDQDDATAEGADSSGDDGASKALPSLEPEATTEARTEEDTTAGEEAEQTPSVNVPSEAPTSPEQEARPEESDDVVEGVFGVEGDLPAQPEFVDYRPVFFQPPVYGDHGSTSETVTSSYISRSNEETVEESYKPLTVHENPIDDAGEAAFAPPAVGMASTSESEEEQVTFESPEISTQGFVDQPTSDWVNSPETSTQNFADQPGFDWSNSEPLSTLPGTEMPVDQHEGPDEEEIDLSTASPELIRQISQGAQAEALEKQRARDRELTRETAIAEARKRQRIHEQELTKETTAEPSTLETPAVSSTVDQPGPSSGQPATLFPFLPAAENMPNFSLPEQSSEQNPTLPNNMFLLGANIPPTTSQPATTESSQLGAGIPPTTSEPTGPTNKLPGIVYSAEEEWVFDLDNPEYMQNVEAEMQLQLHIARAQEEAEKKAKEKKDAEETAKAENSAQPQGLEIGEGGNEASGSQTEPTVTDALDQPGDKDGDTEMSPAPQPMFEEQQFDRDGDEQMSPAPPIFEDQQFDRDGDDPMLPALPVFPEQEEVDDDDGHDVYEPTLQSSTQQIYPQQEDVEMTPAFPEYVYEGYDSSSLYGSDDDDDDDGFRPSPAPSYHAYQEDDDDDDLDSLFDDDEEDVYGLHKNPTTQEDDVEMTSDLPEQQGAVPSSSSAQPSSSSNTSAQPQTITTTLTAPAPARPMTAVTSATSISFGAPTAFVANSRPTGPPKRKADRHDIRDKSDYHKQGKKSLTEEQHEQKPQHTLALLEFNHKLFGDKPMPKVQSGAGSAAKATSSAADSSSGSQPAKPASTPVQAPVGSPAAPTSTDEQIPDSLDQPATPATPVSTGAQPAAPNPPSAAPTSTNAPQTPQHNSAGQPTSNTTPAASTSGTPNSSTKNTRVPLTPTELQELASIQARMTGQQHQGFIRILVANAKANLWNIDPTGKIVYDIEEQTPITQERLMRYIRKLRDENKLETPAEVARAEESFGGNGEGASKSNYRAIVEDTPRSKGKEKEGEKVIGRGGGASSEDKQDEEGPSFLEIFELKLNVKEFSRSQKSDLIEFVQLQCTEWDEKADVLNIDKLPPRVLDQVAVWVRSEVARSDVQKRQDVEKAVERERKAKEAEREKKAKEADGGQSSQGGAAGNVTGMELFLRGWAKEVENTEALKAMESDEMEHDAAESAPKRPLFGRRKMDRRG